MRDRILVTGVGAVSAAGMSVEENVGTLSAGRRPLHTPELLKTSLKLPVGEVMADSRELLSILGLHKDKVVTRTALLAALAVSEAVRDAGLGANALQGGRTGLILGTSAGGMDLSEIFYEEAGRGGIAGDLNRVRMHDCGATVRFVADYIGLKGFSTAVSTACSSAGNAIMLGARMIMSGLLDTVIAGGSDPLCRFTINGFNSLRILSSDLCRPFDIARDGLNLGEGAGFIVLARERPGMEMAADGKAYCTLSGWANTDEAYHQTGSQPSGVGAYASMSEALSVAGLNPGDIDYINTHGTATRGNDLAECTAIRRLFGDRAVFGSFKGYIGHTLAASEGIEAVLCAVSIKRQAVWPSAGFSEPDPEIGISPLCPSGMQPMRIRHLVSNSFGFGGNDSSLVFSRLSS